MGRPGGWGIGCGGNNIINLVNLQWCHNQLSYSQVGGLLSFVRIVSIIWLYFEWDKITWSALGYNCIESDFCRHFETVFKSDTLFGPISTLWKTVKRENHHCLMRIYYNIIYNKL